MAEHQADLALAAQPLDPAGGHPALSLNLVPEDPDRFGWSQLVLAQEWGPSLDLRFIDDDNLLLAACLKGQATLGGRSLGAQDQWSLILASLDPSDGRLRCARLEPIAEPIERLLLQGDSEAGLWLAMDSRVQALGPGAQALWTQTTAGRLLEMVSLGHGKLVLALRAKNGQEILEMRDREGKQIWQVAYDRDLRLLDLHRHRDNTLLVLGEELQGKHPCVLLEFDQTGQRGKRRSLKQEKNFRCQKIGTAREGALLLAGVRADKALAFLRLPKLLAPVDWRLELGQLAEDQNCPTRIQALTPTRQGDLGVLAKLCGRLPSRRSGIIQASKATEVWLMLRPSSFSTVQKQP